MFHESLFQEIGTIDSGRKQSEPKQEEVIMVKSASKAQDPSPGTSTGAGQVDINQPEIQLIEQWFQCRSLSLN